MPSRRHIWSRFQIALLLASVISLSAVGYSEAAGGSVRHSRSALTPKYGGTLAVRTGDTFDGWVPDHDFNYGDNQVLITVLEPLLHAAAAGEGVNGSGLSPGLAKSWSTSADGRTLTFQLQPTARFSTGKPVTSADVAFSVTQWKKGSNFGSLFADISKVETPSQHTVIFQLKQRDNFLPFLLTWGASAVMPSNFGSETAAEFARKPIGAGPFMIASQNAALTNISLKRNPYYYEAGHPYLSGVNYQIVPDENSRILQFNAGTADVLDAIPADQASRIPKNEQDLHYTTRDMVIVPNHAKSPTGNLDLLRAISLAINRSQLVTVMGGQAIEPTGIFPHHVVDWALGCSSCNWDTYSVSAAKRELAKAGYPHGITLKLAYGSSIGGFVLAAEALQAQLAKAGIKITLQPADYSAVFQSFINGKYQLGLDFEGSFTPSPGDILSYYASTEWDFAHVKGPKTNSLLQAYDTASTPQQRSAAVAAVQTWVYQNSPLIPLFDIKQLDAISSKVHNLQMLPWSNYYLSQVWLSS